MFGESTVSATFPAVALGNPNGTALFCVNELTRVASERVCSAREAIELMGGLAEQHGFYGADGGAGEVLMVGDPTLCAVCMVVASERDDMINVLSWDRNSFSYMPQRWDFAQMGLDYDDFEAADDKPL